MPDPIHYQSTRDTLLRLTSRSPTVAYKIALVYPDGIPETPIDVPGKYISLFPEITYPRMLHMEVTLKRDRGIHSLIRDSTVFPEHLIVEIIVNRIIYRDELLSIDIGRLTQRGKPRLSHELETREFEEVLGGLLERLVVDWEDEESVGLREVAGWIKKVTGGMLKHIGEIKKRGYFRDV